MRKRFYLLMLITAVQAALLSTVFASWKSRNAGIFIMDSIIQGISEKPTDIGSNRELLVDDFLIARQQGVDLLLHAPVAGQTVMVFDKPWEGSGSDFETVIRDGNIFRMYYTAAEITNTAGTKIGGHPNYACYAESADGIHWVKPDLGLFDFNGSKQNNIIWSMPHFDNFTPFKDANPDCLPDERYKAMGSGKGGLFAFKSADGIHWSYLADTPVITKGAFDTQNNAFWDPLRKQYWCYIRDFHNGIRDIRVASSTDFHKWTIPELIKFSELLPDEALYTNQVVPYYRAPGLFLGFPTRYVDRKNLSDAAMRALPDPEHRKRRMSFSPRYGSTVTDGLFMSSRDGIHFNKWEQPFIRAGIQRSNNWVYGDGYQSLGLLETPSEDRTAPPELSFYAGEGHWKDSPTLRRYTIRIDGFVSLHAGWKGGEFVSRPLIFSGAELTINFRTSAAGSIFVELEDMNGKPLPGFSLSECDELFGDTLDRKVSWNDRSDVSALAGKPVRIRMVLKEADLYSFKFGKGDVK